MKLMIGAVVLGGLLTGCVLLSPPEPGTSRNTPAYPQTQPRESAPSTAPAAPPGAQAPAPPMQQAPQQRAFTLGPAATSLVGAAHAQEQSRNFGLAAETLERALSIEPHNPLVWIELG